MKKLILSALITMFALGTTFAITETSVNTTKISRSSDTEKTIKKLDDKWYWCVKISSEETYNPMDGSTTVTTTYNCVEVAF